MTTRAAPARPPTTTYREGQAMRIGSLFSGAGGLDMAVEAVFDAHVVWHSEIDPAASKVLAHHWPEVPNLGDITQIGWDNVEPVDILCGGFPCQDVSAAGKRAGIKDGTRSGLWSIFADAIEALRPPIVIIENVRGLLSAKAHRDMESDPADMGNGADRPILRAAGAVLGDLADLGYDAQWVTYAAGDIGAPHRRERVFILAATADARHGDQPERPRPPRWDARERLPVGTVTRGISQTSVDLLQTPQARDGKGLPGSGFNAGNLHSQVANLLPTPNASDGSGGGQHPDKREGHSRQLIDYVLLCTPSASDGAGGKTSRSGSRISEPLLGGQAREMATAWGKYAPAIARWEALTRPAPAPTEPNKNGNPRLAAPFSEWMMGWPLGHVTDPAIGLSRNDQLRIVGNGVCPQQAQAAIRYLVGIAGGNLLSLAGKDPHGYLLPTPRALDSTGVRGRTPNRSDEANSRAGRTLTDEVTALLPTPVVTDSFGARNSTSGRKPDSQHHSGDTLTNAMWKLAADRGEMELPTGPRKSGAAE